jgi:hydrogenase maturation protease
MPTTLDDIFSLVSPMNALPHSPRLLFYGIGNVGRQDDGLGIRLIEELENLNLPAQIELQSNYQLNIEDALEISNFDVVIFVDATIEKDAIAPFALRPIKPSDDIAFSTHAMGMESILALSDQLYGRTPKAFVLTIPGYSWEIKDELTEAAQQNLTSTIAALKQRLLAL